VARPCFITKLIKFIQGSYQLYSTFIRTGTILSESLHSRGSFTHTHTHTCEFRQTAALCVAKLVCPTVNTVYKEAKEKSPIEMALEDLSQQQNISECYISLYLYTPSVPTQ